MIYFAGGYVKLPDVFKLGIIMAIVNFVIWGLTGETPVSFRGNSPKTFMQLCLSYRCMYMYVCMCICMYVWCWR